VALFTFQHFQTAFSLFSTFHLQHLSVFLLGFGTCLLPIQAYMLNPAIYSAHLKLHPLMVLCALVVAEHNMGVWGLLLAVPMTVFALDYLIRYPDSSVTEVGAKELEKVMHTHDEGDQLPAEGRGTSSPATGSADSYPVIV
jgi:predicted PurR-regulated permease PerM